jgi:tetratricopeptide (TPR) repeat protein
VIGPLRTLVAAGAVFLIGGCSVPRETAVPPAPETSESLYQEGHRLYTLQNYDSAAVLFQRSLGEDSSYVPALSGLAMLYYDRGTQKTGQSDSSQRTYLTKSFYYFAKSEALGSHEAGVYDRLCEIAVQLDDVGSFLRYAEKYAEAYPYDRQYYNLGLAYFDAGEYRKAIESQKEALQKFPESLYAGSFSRLLGQAYMKVDRYQTAQRVFASGVELIDKRLAQPGISVESRHASDEAARMKEDQVSMLRSLRYLYRIYKEEEKLRQVERRLKEFSDAH